jgi:hypothetical protein
VTIKRLSVFLTAAGFALALSATTGLTCDDHKATDTADAKAAGAKTAKAVPAAETATGEPGCCAKKAMAAKQTAGAKGAKAIPAVAAAGCDKPCDGATAGAEGAGCPKKAAAATATVAQAQPEKPAEAAPADAGKEH